MNFVRGTLRGDRSDKYQTWFAQQHDGRVYVMWGGFWQSCHPSVSLTDVDVDQC